jgi:transposase
VLVELSVVEQRYAAVLEVVRDGLSVAEVAERYGVSRQSIYTWVANYEAGGLAGLADRSHKPVSCPHQMAPALEATICEMRRTFEAADLACVVEVERFRARVGESTDLSPVSLRVTSLFRLERGEWRPAHRHADLITAPRPAGSVLGSAE